MTTSERPRAALLAATAHYRQIDAARTEAHDAVIAEIVAALKAGEMPTAVAEDSPFTAAHVRKLAREAGVPRAKPGIKPKKAAP